MFGIKQLKKDVRDIERDLAELGLLRAGGYRMDIPDRILRIEKALNDLADATGYRWEAPSKNGSWVREDDSPTAPSA